MKIKQNQNLSEYTTIGVGGKIRWMFFPENLDDIVESVQFCVLNRLPFFILAGGSNTVFEDENLYFRQAVVNLRLLNKLKMQVIKEKTILEIDPGCTLQTVVDTAQELNLVGVTELNRIPGTIGGAIVGNAGAYGVEIGSVVQQVEYIDLDKLQKKIAHGLKFSNSDLKIAKKVDCNFNYRHSFFKNGGNFLITKIWLELTSEINFQSEIQKYNEIANKRDLLYPKGFKSPGSVFKNIKLENLNSAQIQNIPENWVVYGDKIPVAKFLEVAGAKGFKIGDAGMRETHANILCNSGAAKFSDIKSLIQILQLRVKEKFNVEIEPEIRLIPGNFTHFKH